MPLSRLARIDLNLLVALEVLLEERNVTRAAERLFITQPAMSKTLQRLRALFEDELFVRSGRELIPTARALEIQEQLPQLLTEIETLVSGRRFDPLRDRGTIHLATPEFMAVQLSDTLIWDLPGEAPHFTLAISSQMEDYQLRLKQGELDFVLAVQTPVGDEFEVTSVGGIAPAVWMRKGHPLAAEERLELRQVLEYPFIQYFLLQAGSRITPFAATRFDRAIAEMGLKRRKALVTDQLMTALYALQHSDCLMLATQDDLKTEAGLFEIVRKPYPEDLPHDAFIPVALYQHRRTARSSMHQWFRERLLAALERVYAGQGARA
ncbi:MAG: LysR family transcriptional regulator [Porticoccaceae bacterium]|nr:MAG: LysR family transcriptional regulator [Porticoccaceae bacterium]